MQTYQRSVDLGAMPSARVENGAMPAAYGANVAQAMGGMGDALGNGFNSLTKGMGGLLN